MPRRRTKPDTLDLTAQYRPGWMNEADRRYRNVQAVLRAREAYMEDLGGLNSLSIAKQMIVDRVIFIVLRLTELERLALQDKDIDWSHYAYLSNILAGHLKTLGLERHVKKVGSLREYIEGDTT